MDVDAAVRALKSSTSLGVATGTTEVYRIGISDVVEVHALAMPQRDIPFSDFREQFKHCDFRRLTVTDHAQ